MGILDIFASHKRIKNGKKSVQLENNARRYRTDTTYLLPKDHKEEERINFQHHILHQVIGGHYKAPLQADCYSMLDVGSGTGKWAADMAKLFPHTKVIGLDIEAPLKRLVTPPPNYHFVNGNILQGLPFSNSTFSYVHQRFLVAAIPALKWPLVIKELVRVTAPGGYVELLEGGDTYLNPGPATQQMLQWGKAASTYAGIDASLMAQLDSMLLSAGLREVQKKEIQVPIGQWGGRHGAMLATDMEAGLLGLKRFYGSRLAVKAEHFDETIKALAGEWERYRTSYVFYLAYGQKPCD